MKIRSQLDLLALGAIAPLLIASVIAGLVLVDHEQETFQREALGRARSAMSAIDTELRGSLTTMQALAVSKSLETGDLRAFHAEDGHPISQRGLTAIRVMLEPDSQQGSIMLLKTGEQPGGYGALCLGFSIEYEGREAEAILRGLVIGAMKGDARSQVTLFKLAETTGQLEAPGNSGDQHVTFTWLDPEEVDGAPPRHFPSIRQDKSE